jgi:hypothetical protein
LIFEGPARIVKELRQLCFCILGGCYMCVWSFDVRVVEGCRCMWCVVGSMGGAATCPYWEVVIVRVATCEEMG